MESPARLRASPSIVSPLPLPEESSGTSRFLRMHSLSPPN